MRYRTGPSPRSVNQISTVSDVPSTATLAVEPSAEPTNVAAGAPVGAAVGTAAGVVGVGLAPEEFAATARVPWVSIAVIVVGAIGLGAVAAALPARAAVRREPLEDLDAP